jgi:hypothetical protein
VSNPWDQPKQNAGFLPFAIVLSAMFFFGYWVRTWDFSKRDDDRQEQVDPKPAKLEKGSHVIVVEETGDRKKFPFIATLQSDRAYWDALKASGINWGFYDADSPSVESYEADIKAAGLPTLLVISPAGRVLLSKSLPPTTESIDEALRSIR